MKEKITVVAGWIGTIFIMIAYTINSFGIISSEEIIYPILNLLGAIFLGYRLYKAKIWANVFLEVFWGGIAIVSIFKYFYF